MMPIKRLCVCAMLLLMTACQSRNTLSSKYEEFIHSGETLPLVQLTDIDGNILDFQRLNTKKLIILFATWCPDSHRLLQALNTSDILIDDSVKVIAIAREPSIATVKQWRDKYHSKVVLAVDENREIYNRFTAGGIPRLITVDENNRVIKMNLAEGGNQLASIEWNP